MIIQKMNLSEAELPSPECAYPAGGVFFDIETTGLSHRTSHLYLIGAVYKENQTWQYIQWFLQKPSEEKQVLTEFSAFLRRFDTVIHYNGQTFDIPYLKGRYEYWELPDPFLEPSPKDSLDLFRVLTPMKQFLRLDSMKQKAVEQLLSFPRKDERDGKELIDVYHQYLKTAGQEELRLLLLHNHDDLLGMLTIYHFHTYLTQTLPCPSLTDFQIRDQRMILQLQTGLPSPVPLGFQSETLSLRIEGVSLTLTLQGYEGCFRHYYPNYKDYFYLPLEDTAIHKSVGIYVDPSCREKAKADTCYTKKEGLFFPQPSPVFTPDFRRDSRKGDSWFLAEQLKDAPKEALEMLAAQQIGICLKARKR